MVTSGKPLVGRALWGAMLTLLTVMSLGPARADFASAVADYRQNKWHSAFPEFLRLAEGGDARAQAVVALMYRSGEGTPPSLEQAYQWYRKAADKGYAPAAYHVGMMLLNGDGIEPDHAAGARYIAQAANQGHTRALAMRDDLKVQTPAPPDEEPKTWSRNWNLKLPADTFSTMTDFAEIAPQPSVRVQLGAMSTIENATNLWEISRRRAPYLFADLSYIVKTVATADGEVYKVQAGPFDSARAADKFCRTLKYQTEQDCMVITP